MTITRRRLLFLIVGISIVVFAWLEVMVHVAQMPRSGLAILLAFWALAPAIWFLIEEYFPNTDAHAGRLHRYAYLLWIVVGALTFLLALRAIIASQWALWNRGPVAWNIVVDVVRIAIWPVVVLLSLVLFREPLGSFFNALGTRASRIGAFNLTIELADVPVARAWSGPSLDDLKSEYPAAAGDSSGSLFTAIADTSYADYLTVNLEDGKAWLTSRLFILASLIPRIRPIKRIVFLSDPAEEFLGEARPADVVSALAIKYPWLEQAYIESHIYAVQNQLNYNQTLLGPINPTDGNMILNSFLNNVKGPPQPTGWVTLGHYSEHAEWITKDSLLQLLGKRLNPYSVKRDPAVADKTAARVLLRTDADYVAIVDTFDRFRNLVDRYRALDEVVRRETAAT